MNDNPRGRGIGSGIAWRVLALCGTLAAAGCSDAAGPTGPGDLLPPIGAVDLSVHSSGAGSVDLRFESGRESYLLAFQSTSATTATFGLRINADVPLSASLLASSSASPTEGTGSTAPPGEAVEAEVRHQGKQALRLHGPAAQQARSPQTEPAPRRSFWIDDPLQDRVVQRPATLKHAGLHALVYVDDAVPAALVDAGDAAALAQRFEAQVYPRVRALYGSESDLDANSRVMLFLTPLVNQWVRPEECRPEIGWSGIAGYFDHADMSDAPFSNRGEILYLMVPDPQGQFACATDTKQKELDDLVGVTAHELTHAIAFNERHFRRNLPVQEDWLEEALAHYAEIELGMPVLARGQINHYLRNRSAHTSLTGTDAAEAFMRGAATLFVARLVERFGRDVLGRLVTGPGVGVATVEGATGEPFAGLFHDWSLALYNDVYPVPSLAPRFSSLDLRAWVEARFGPMRQAQRDAVAYRDPYGGGVYHALGPYSGEAQRLTGTVTMKNASVVYVVVTGGKGAGKVNVRFAAPASAKLQVAAVRIE